MNSKLNFARFFQFIVFVFIFNDVFGIQANGFVITGEGHYGIRPLVQTRPAFSGSRGMLQGTQQSFYLLAQAKNGDDLNFNLGIDLFPGFEPYYLGNTTKPRRCSSVEGEGDNAKISQQGLSRDCEGREQDHVTPGYSPFQPSIREAYFQYALDFCLLEVGRRSRNWGMGALLDDGRGPFSKDASIFDGFGCSVNLQKYQTSSLTFGLDKLAEANGGFDPTSSKRQNNSAYAASDDLSQVYFSFTTDSRKGHVDFSREVGIYVGMILGRSEFQRGDEVQSRDTDVKIADIYNALYWNRFRWISELVFRMGNSADASYVKYGGLVNRDDGDLKSNSVDAMALATKFSFNIGREFPQFAEDDNYTFNHETLFHEFSLLYAYAPGDSNGYRSADDRYDQNLNSAKGFAFHANFNPTMILFSGDSSYDDLYVDGIFDPERLMNVSLFGFNYTYFNRAYGKFTTNLIAADLVNSAPASLRSVIAAKELAGSTLARPIGFSGSHLGYELNVKYERCLQRNTICFSGFSALAVPGIAWKIKGKEKPEMASMLGAEAVFKF